MAGVRRTLPSLLRLVALSATAFVASSARAHDQWLEPERRPFPTGATANVALHVGEAPASDEEKVFERAKFTQLFVRSRNGPVDLLGTTKEGARPVIALDGLGKGEFLVVADRARVLIELEPTKFEAYLVEEGLADVTRERAARGETNKPGRERYTRHMKSLVHVGDVVDHGLAAAAQGQHLEILVETPAAARGHDKSLNARVVLDRRPLAGAAVQLSVRTASGPRHLDGRTSGDGRVSFAHPPAGFAILHLVHMRRCLEPDGSPCRDADWESAWGSFSFDLP